MIIRESDRLDLDIQFYSDARDALLKTLQD